MIERFFKSKKSKNTLKSLELGNRLKIKILHLYNKSAEVAKAENENECAEYFRRTSKALKESIKESEKLINKIKGN
jgi:rubrerythrin